MADYGDFKLTFNDAKSRVDALDRLNNEEFEKQIRQWAAYNVSEDNYSEIYRNIREKIVDEFKRVLAENKNRIDYSLDLQVGLKLYELMNPNNGFDIVKANDDDIWRYISLCVIPDLTFIRYPNQQTDINILAECIPNLTYAISVKTEKDSLRIKKKRFYSHTRRIWIKTLWWYIHLGWQGDLSSTYNTLKNNGTNIISHFIERPGRGYRETLFRSMLYAYSCLPEQKDGVFRAAAKLNLAKCVSVEPALTLGGEPVYSKKLFNEVLTKKLGDQSAEG